MSEIGELSQSVIQTEKVNRIPSTESGRKLARTLESANVDYDIKKTGIEQLPELFLLKNQEIPSEPCVRVYRGIGNVETVLKQVPYAMRAKDSFGHAEIVNEIKDVVDSLADNPTYEKLTQYMEIMSYKQGEKERTYFAEKLNEIENNMLRINNLSLAKELKWQTLNHTGGNVAEIGLTPYLSGGMEMSTAFRFTKTGGGIMIVDIPVSKIGTLDGSTTGEIYIKGNLDKKYIKGVVIKNKNAYIDDDNDENQVIFDKIEELIGDENIYKGEKLTEILKNQNVQEEARESEQLKIDLEQIRSKKAKNLIDNFSYSIPDIQELVNSNQGNTDKYTHVKEAIFDYYKGKIEEFGENLDDRVYKSATFSAKEEKYDRNKVDEDMLNSLRTRTKNLTKNHELMMERRRELAEMRMKNNSK